MTLIKKPSGVISYDIEKIKDEIIYKVKAASGVNVKKLQIYVPSVLFPEPARGAIPISPHLVKGEERGGKEIIVIGSSTGGPRAVVHILAGIPSSISAAILIVQHMAPEFVPSFVERLQWVSNLNVSIAGEGDVISPGRVFVADGDSNAVINRNKNYLKIHLDRSLSHYSMFPSVDTAMESAADSYRENTIGIILTGMGHDGAAGIKAIKNAACEGIRSE